MKFWINKLTMFPAKTDSTSWKMQRTPMMYPIQQRHLIKVIRSSKMIWLRIMTNTGEALVMDWTTAMEIICHAWKRQLRRAPAKTIKDNQIFSKRFIQLCITFDLYIFSIYDKYLPTVQKANNQIDKFEVGLRCETAGKKDSRLCILQPAIQVVWRTPRKSRTIFLSISSLMFRSIKL